MLLIRTSSEQPFMEPTVTSHPNEAELQTQILKRPSLLPTAPSLALVSEFGIPSVGRVDLVGVAADGAVWLVECKLANNPQIRREIVGQVLAYAGGLWKMPYEDFAATFAARGGGTALLTAVQQSVGGELDLDAVADGVRDSLARGRFTLVLAVDRITDELKTIVEFLDQHTTTDIRVMALEMAYYREGTVEILTPVTYGDQLTKVPPPNQPARWTEDGFLAALAEIADDAVRSALEDVIEHGRQKGRHPFWGSGSVPGMSYYYGVDGKDCPVWAMYLKPSGPVVAVSFGSIAHASPGKALAVLEALKAHGTFASHVGHVEASALNKYPNIPASALTQESDREAFLSALDLALA